MYTTLKVPVVKVLLAFVKEVDSCTSTFEMNLRSISSSSSLPLKTWTTHVPYFSIFNGCRCNYL